MPIYEYQCRACGHRLETMQKISDPPLTTCPECEGELKKLISAPAFQFKGSGWYVTDYAGKKGGAGSERSSGGDSAESGGSGGDGGEGKGKGGSDVSGTPSKASESKGSSAAGSGTKTSD